MDTNSLPSLPEIASLLLDSPIYSVYKANEVPFVAYVYGLLSFTETLDTYCLECGRQSTFRGVYNRERNIPKGQYGHLSLSEFMKSNISSVTGRPLNVELQCTRSNTHKMMFLFYLTNETITKIGQLPSLADVTMPEIKKYQKVLAGDYKEFSRAIGLTTHGVGIGAFVYLRRIFENLIEEAHQTQLQQIGWDDAAYGAAKMADKILMLKEYLPAFLVRNKALYSILSKGIHELSEEECLKVFPAIKVSIELILDQKLIKIAEVKKEKEAEEALAKIMNGINK